MKTITVKDGVYMKRNGDLVNVYEEFNEKRNRNMIVIDEGKIKRHSILRLNIAIVIESTSRELGWGPTRFFHQAEYLGEL